MDEAHVHILILDMDVMDTLAYLQVGAVKQKTLRIRIAQENHQRDL